MISFDTEAAKFAFVAVSVLLGAGIGLAVASFDVLAPSSAGVPEDVERESDSKDVDRGSRSDEPVSPDPGAVASEVSEGEAESSLPSRSPSESEFRELLRNRLIVDSVVMSTVPDQDLRLLEVSSAADEVERLIGSGVDQVLVSAENLEPLLDELGLRYSTLQPGAVRLSEVLSSPDLAIPTESLPPHSGPDDAADPPDQPVDTDPGTETSPSDSGDGSPNESSDRPSSSTTEIKPTDPAPGAQNTEGESGA